MKPRNRRSRVVSAALGVGVAGLTLAGALSRGTSIASTTPPETAAPGATVASTAAVTPAYTAPKRTLQYGDSGSDVKALQERLAALKYYPRPVNGQFGSDTREAVWAFQEVQGLPVDGQVSLRTSRALVHPRSYVARDPRGGSRRVEVNLGTRVLVLYRDNKVALISHISAGGGYHFCNPGGGCGYAITPTGDFRTTVYIPGWITVPLGHMYNSEFFIGTSYAIHGEYNSAVPIEPVSHGCVRIPFDVAQAFPSMVKTPGTAVYVY
jgi:peptidoglycan hydrolase-like protein with peptidoglycan-binding domain